MSALNRSAGKRFQASPDLFSVVALARRFFHLTRGLFDPSILPDLKRAGYDRSMEVLREQGPSPLFESLLASEHPSFSEMDLDESDHTILLPPGMALDLGGIAKGWIAEQAANILSGYATACAVDAGGDMFLVGLPDGLEQWPVALEDPLQPENILTSLQVDPGAIATSTITKRVWKQAGKNRHHIIDPRTGEPAVSDWISVTVIAPHAYEAEVFAKALLIAGPQEAEEIVRHSGIPVHLPGSRPGEENLGQPGKFGGFICHNNSLIIKIRTYSAWQVVVSILVTFFVIGLILIGAVAAMTPTGQTWEVICAFSSRGQRPDLVVRDTCVRDHRLPALVVFHHTGIGGHQ